MSAPMSKEQLATLSAMVLIRYHLQRLAFADMNGLDRAEMQEFLAEVHRLRTLFANYKAKPKTQRGRHSGGSSSVKKARKAGQQELIREQR